MREASDVLGVESVETVAGNTAMEAARTALAMLSLGLEQADEEGSETVPGILPPP